MDGDTTGGAEPAADKRGAPRQRTLRGGKIVWNGGFNSHDCVVRNLSRTGARLDTGTFLRLPDRFSLKFEDGRTLPVEVIWTRVNEMGVRFEGAGLADAMDVVRALVGRIEAIEQEVGELKQELRIHFPS